MNVERLQLLRAVMVEVDEKHKPLDMEEWINLFLPNDASIADIRALCAEEWAMLECGTACCALGFLARDPRAQALGMGLVRASYGRVWPSYRGAVETGEAFFEITAKEANFLFLPTYYHRDEDEAGDEITPDHVIEHIDWLLAGHHWSDFYN